MRKFSKQEARKQTQTKDYQKEVKFWLRLFERNDYHVFTDAAIEKNALKSWKRLGCADDT